MKRHGNEPVGLYTESDTTMMFDQMGLCAPILKVLQRLQFTTPTPIQAQAIPAALAGQDVLASAQTGTGKTAAFLIPAIQQLVAGQRQGLLILTPTRELALQVMDVARDLMGGMSQPLRSAILVGGQPMVPQIKKLKAGPVLIIGTPGRVADHLRRKTLRLNTVDFIVLDEVDRMLDMGFRQEVEGILAQTAPKRQSLMFSATLSEPLEKMANRFLHKPLRINVAPATKTNANIRHLMLKTSREEKLTHLKQRISGVDGSMIVFVNTKHLAEKLKKKLADDLPEVDTLHGNLSQSKRQRVTQSFRNGQTRVLIATDVAARGLDVPDISWVINYDLPMCTEDYVHRSGRTGRAGSQGSALTFVCPNENGKWRRLDQDLKLKAVVA